MNQMHHFPDTAAAANQAAPVELCPARLLHFRLKPVQHRFEYGVFFIRLQLRRLAAAETQAESIGWPKLFSLNRFNLLSFHVRDHLGDDVAQKSPQAMLEWADALLRQQGIEDADGEMVLQCFPRVLGYVFNPVSFWFCHRCDGSLRAVICVVNNTFGERHIYLLDNGSTINDGEQLTAGKVFHVSPFFAVEGSYRFCFSHGADAGPALPQYQACIDYWQADGPALLTSLRGQPEKFDDRSILKLCLRHPFMSLGVMIKIHIQAFQLWRKKLPVFRKPTPPAEKLSR